MSLALLVVGAVGGVCHAQTAAGSIRGHVKDAHGRVLPAVSLVASSPALTAAASTLSDGTGTYRLEMLPAGTYAVTASLAGFATYARSGIVLKAGDNLGLEIVMNVAGVADEVTVVGTNIRGADVVGIAPIVITRDEIAKGGFDRVDDVLRALPQTFGGGARDDTLVQQPLTSDRTVAGNTGKGVGVNLRGLGTDATLVLVDGRRLAPSGSAGLFTDISNIPIGSIERIEVLTDGASALYGSDAIAGVVNIVLRKDDRGFETQVRGTSGVGGNSDYRFTQSYGAGWGSGRLTASYDYYRRGELVATERPFAASSDQRPHGGDDFSANSGIPGTIFVGTRTWALPAGQDGKAIDLNTLTEGTINWRNANENLWMLPRHHSHGMSSAFSQNIGGRFTAWTHVLANRRRGESLSRWGDSLTVPSTNPFYVNPTGASTPIVVRYDMTKDFGNPLTWNEVNVVNGAAGLEAKVWRSWRIDVQGSYATQRAASENLNINRPALALALADSNPATAYNPFGDQNANHPATIESFRATAWGRTTSSVAIGNVLAEGPMITLPGGAVRLAAGGEYRDYLLRSARGLRHDPAPIESVRFTRNVQSVFAEVRVPIIGVGNRLPGFHEVVVSMAGRREHYNDFGGSTVPKFAVTYLPTTRVRLGATWSMSFRAPDLASLNESVNTASITNLPDPVSPTGNSTVLSWSGNNAGLKSETSRTVNASLDVEMPGVPALRIGVTYFDIDYVNRLQTPFGGASAADILGNPAFSPFWTRTPAPDYRQRICDSDRRPTFNLQACLTTPIAAIVDLRLQNTAKLETHGIDLRIRHAFATPLGNMTYGVNGAFILAYDQATVETFPTTSRLNLKYNPVDFRLRGDVAWERNGWDATVFVNYTDAYRDVTPSVTRAIDAFTTIDVDAGFRPRRGPLAGFGVSLHVQNLFNTDPPFVNTALGYDVTNANPYGRVAQLALRKRW